MKAETQNRQIPIAYDKNSACSGKMHRQQQRTNTTDNNKHNYNKAESKEAECNEEKSE